MLLFGKRRIKKPVYQAPLFEELEPRLLFSADVAEPVAVLVVEQELDEEPVVNADIDDSAGSESASVDLPAAPPQQDATAADSSDETAQTDEADSSETESDTDTTQTPSSDQNVTATADSSAETTAAESEKTGDEDADSNALPASGADNEAVQVIVSDADDILDNDATSVSPALDTSTTTTQPSSELVFVNQDIQDSDQLVEDIVSREDRDRSIEVIVLDDEQDGIAQVTQILDTRSDVSAVHFVGHGLEGQFKLGSSWLDSSTLLQQSDTLASWGSALSEDGDILLYGCNLAATAEGQLLVDSLGSLTGADVAASDDDTGHAIFNADWELEYTAGDVETTVVFSQELQGEWGHLLNVVVDSTSTARSSGGDLEFDHTTSGTDRLMLVGVSMNLRDGSETVGSVTYNSDNLTLVGAQTDGDARVELWGLVNPDLGTSKLTVDIIGTTGESDGNTVGVMTFTGVDQTTALGTFGWGTGVSGSASATIATGATDYVFGVIAVDDPTDYDLVPGGTQDEVWDLYGYQISGGGSISKGDGDLSWTWSGSDSWAIGGVAIKAASGNSAPVISSDGGGATAALQIVEQNVAVTTVVATDPNGDTLSYSITGGADAAKFSINETTGVLRFTSGQDYETPADANLDNVYEVTVEVADGFGATDSQAISVSIIQNSGTAIWRDSTTTPQATSWDGTAFGATTSTAPSGDYRIMQGAEAPTRDEIIIIGVTESSEITGEIWDGTSWTVLPAGVLGSPLGTVSQDYWWSMDVAYEQASGDAVLVWCDGTETKSSVWDGTDWMTPVTIEDFGASTPRQMQLAAQPTGDEMVLVVSDSTGSDSAWVWDGAGWGSQVTLDTTGGALTSVYATYEQQSGHAMVTYGKDSNANVFYQTWDGSAWSGENSIIPLAVSLSASPPRTEWITLASDPNSDQIAMGVVTSGGTAADIWLVVWDGSSWETPIMAETTATGSIFPSVAVAFESDSGQALAAYGQDGVDSVQYRTWSGGTWSAEQTGPNTIVGANSLILNADPYSDNIMLSVQDQDSDVSYICWDGTSWGAATELATETTEVKNQPFLFLWDQNPQNIAPSDLQVTATSEGGASLNEDGGNDVYFLADDGSGLLGGLSTVTIETSFSITTPGTDLSPLLSYASGSNDEELALFLKSDGRIWFGAHSNGSVIQSTASTYAQLFDGDIHHVAVSWDASNGAVEFYVDGQLEESFTGYQTGQSIASGGELVFGQDQDSVDGGYKTIDVFSGTLYDIRIFDDIRTSTEIADNYETTLPSTEAGMIANWTFNDLTTDGIITDSVSGNNLTEQHVVGVGFSTSTPELTLRVEEGTANGTAIGTLAAIDPDSGDTFSYTLVDTAGGRFAIDSSTGELTLADSSLIDFETDSSHTITVRVTDSGALTYDEIFTVNVINLNEVPVINDLTVTLAEDAANSTVVANINDANTSNDTDQDGTALSYSITAGNGDGVFSVDGSTGVITVSDNTNLDFETTTQYVLTVRATDGTLTDTAAVTINVTDVVETAVFTIDAIADTTVAENVAFTAVTPSLSGATPIGDVTYSLTGTDAADFTVDSATGVVSMVARDYETPVDDNSNNIYEVTLVATDDDGNTDSEDFTVTVTNLEDNSSPVLSGANNLAAIDEDDFTNSGTLVSTLLSGQVSDADIGAESGIAVIDVDNTNGTWQYTINGGALWTDFATPTTSTALLLAADAGTSVRFVPDVDWNGTVTDGISFYAWDQTTGVAGDVADLSSSTFTVFDQFETVSYSNDDGTANWTSSWTESNESGTAGPTGGEIRITGGQLRLDNAVSSAGDLPSISREVDLSGATSATSTFDYDGYSSGLPERFKSWASDDGGATWVELEHFTPAQTGAFSDSSSYDLGSSVSLTSNTVIKFSLEQGFASGTDYVDFDNVKIEFTASGTGGTSAFSSATATSDITVIAIDDAPVINDITTSVAENTADATVVVNLNDAITNDDTDRDGSAITYSITAGNGVGIFAIDSSSGVITVADNTNLNYETATQHVLTVTVTDGTLTDTAAVTINVTDVAETANFTIDAIADTTVAENVAFTSVTPSLSGASPIGDVTYTLAGSDAADFTVDSATGVVSMVARDYETPVDDNTNNIYEVTLVATDDDGNTDSEDFTVTVTDAVEGAAFTIDAIADTTVSENVAFTSVTPSLSGATPIGDVTYSLTGTDAADFTVDSATGVVSMVARDYETPVDDNSNNIYEVTLVATDDDGNTDSEDLTVTVTDAVEGAVFTIDAIADTTVAENVAFTSVTPSLSGATPIGDVTYTLAGSDAADFTVDSATGVVSMVARDYETPVDANTNNIYEVTLVATDDDGNTDSEDFTVTITDAVEGAVFTIDAIADTTVSENVAFTSVTPSLSGATPIGDVTYSLTGTDAADFTVDSATGVVSMIARDYETPVDDNSNNIYEVTLVATDDDGNTDSEDFTVTVTDAIEGAVFAIDAIVDTTVAENVAFTSVTPSLSGASPIGDVTYSLTGTDAADFTVDSATGVVSMVARDYETPVDANTNNIYEVTLVATDDDGNTDSEDFTVTVTDAVEGAVFTIDAIADTTVAENVAFTSVAPSLSGATPIGDVTYTLAGSDAADFTVDSATGVVSMVARDYETPVDDNTNNIYEVTLVATDDDGNTDSEDFTVTVTDAVEGAVFTIDAIADTTVAENVAFTSVTPSLSGASPIGDVTYSLTGTDAADFTVDSATGVVSMVARDYETPVDDNTNNTYEVTLVATDDDGNTDSEDFTVTVTDAVEGAVFTIDAIADTTVAENVAFTSVTPSLSGASPIGDVTYSLTGTDAADFTVDSATGVVSMVARDYETPVDANTNNIYEVTLVATDDDGNSANEDFSIAIMDVNEAQPVATGGSGGDVNENDPDESGDNTSPGGSVGDGSTPDHIVLPPDDPIVVTAPDDIINSVDGVLPPELPSGDPVIEVADNLDDQAGDAVSDDSDSDGADGEGTPLESLVRNDVTVQGVDAHDNNQEITGYFVPSDTMLTAGISTSPLAQNQPAQSVLRLFKTMAQEAMNFGVKPVEAALVYFDVANPEITVMENDTMQLQLDVMQQQMEQSYEETSSDEKVVVYLTSGMSISLAAGAVSYLFRAGSLMSSFLATVPVWKGFDPIPVLVTPKKKSKKKKSHKHDPMQRVQDADANAEQMFSSKEG